MFGLNHVLKYVNDTGKTVFTVKDFQRYFGIKRASAKRYLTEARKLGIIEIHGEVVHVDMDKLLLLSSIVEGNIDTETVVKLIEYGKKHGTISAHMKYVHDPEAVEKKLLLVVDDDKALRKFLENSLKTVNDASVLLIVLPKHLVMDAYYVLVNAFREHNIRITEIMPTVKGIVVRNTATS